MYHGTLDRTLEQKNAARQKLMKSEESMCVYLYIYLHLYVEFFNVNIIMYVYMLTRFLNTLSIQKQESPNRSLF